MTSEANPPTEDRDVPAEPREADIDEASDDSFPASDPPSYGAPETGADRD
jgi:hypothetical protein